MPHLVSVRLHAGLVAALALAASACTSHSLVPLEDPFTCAAAQAPADGVGTTERQVLLPASADLYRELVPCAGWERVVRTDLARRTTTQDSGTALLSLVHLSDVHLLDPESPLRVEFLRHARGLFLPAAEFQAGFRPQETMTMQVAESMVRALNALERGPVTDRPFDRAISTGDSGDNHQRNELNWFITLMNGGPVNPDSGAPGYQGVQDGTASPLFCRYWHPDPVAPTACSAETDGACAAGCTDTFRQAGFPQAPGLLAASRVPFTATGLDVPWLLAYGNHDELIQGNFPIHADVAPRHTFDSLATGSSKMLRLPERFRSSTGLAGDTETDFFLLELLNPLALPSSRYDVLRDWTAPEARTVAPDAGRALWTRAEFVQMLTDNPGPYGPVGHGFGADNASGERLYYAVDLVDEDRVAEGGTQVRGIVLDTTDPLGVSDGVLFPEQAAWLEDQLRAVHSRYTAADGSTVETDADDALVIVLSHHNSDTMPLTGSHLVKLLHRYPNVVLWLNGHTHFSRVTPHAAPPGAAAADGFWEINTPSLIDFPQMSRLVEFVDNRDGTLSIFGTLVDHAAPADPDDTDDPVLKLAARSRELAANDPLLNMSSQIGPRDQRNVELILNHPFADR